MTSSKFVQRNRLGGSGHRRQKFFNVPDRLGRQQDVAANRADLRRNVVEHHHVAAALYSMNDRPFLIMPRTTLDCAFHLFVPRILGVVHFGGFGSYTVISTSTG
jgi:hypothetical protein